MLKQDFKRPDKWSIGTLCSVLILVCSLPLAASTRETPARFATPDEAVRAVIEAADANDTAALLKVFGPASEDIVESGNPVEDKAMRAEFVRLAREKVEVHPDGTNPAQANLIVGSAGWPFPIPLIRINGGWQFDIAHGRAAILAHRIGENELDVIEVCRGFVEAQLEYASKSHDGTGVLVYADTMASGLFPKALAEATVTASGSSPRTPFHGYYFRILKSQGPSARGGAFEYVVNGKLIGGFGLVAWPAEYGVSGIKTFVINHDGIVYERDMGGNTASYVNRITKFDPDELWHPVVE